MEKREESGGTQKAKPGALGEAPDAVVNRLKRNLTGVHRDMGLGVDTEKLKQQIRAIGEDEAAKIGEETVLERMVQIDIKPHDVEKAIKKLYKQDTWWWKPGG